MLDMKTPRKIFDQRIKQRAWVLLHHYNKMLYTNQETGNWLNILKKCTYLIAKVQSNQRVGKRD